METIDWSCFNGSKWCELLMQMDKAWISVEPFPSVLGLFRETAPVGEFSFSLSLGERCSINIIKWTKEWVCVGEGKRERDTCNHMHTHTCFPSFSYSVIFSEHLSLFWGQGPGERERFIICERISFCNCGACQVWIMYRKLETQARVNISGSSPKSAGRFQCRRPEAELCCFGEPQSGFSLQLTGWGPPTLRKGVLYSESTGEMLIASIKKHLHSNT